MAEQRLKCCLGTHVLTNTIICWVHNSHKQHIDLIIYEIDTFLHDFSSQGRASSGIPSTSVSIPHSNPFPA